MIPVPLRFHHRITNWTTTKQTRRNRGDRKKIQQHRRNPTRRKIEDRGRILLRNRKPRRRPDHGDHTAINQKALITRRANNDQSFKFVAADRCASLDRTDLCRISRTGIAASDRPARELAAQRQSRRGQANRPSATARYLMAFETDQRAHRHAEFSDLVGAAEFRQIDDETGGQDLGADLF